MIFDRVFLKFFISGVINTVAGSAVMFLLYNVAGLGYWPSSAANNVVAGLVGFFLNKYWTFKIKKWSVFMIGAYIGTIIISYFVAYKAALFAINALLAHQSRTIRDNVAMLAGLCLFSGMSYLGQRFIVFAKRDSGQVVDSDNTHQ